MPSPREFPPGAHEKSREARAKGKFGRQTRFVEAVKEGLSVRQAVIRAGITHETYRNWLKPSDPGSAEFKQRVKDAEEFAVGEIEDAMRETALNGNVKAQEFILVNRAPDRWSSGHSKVQVENTHRLEITADAAAERLAVLMARIEEQRALVSGSSPSDPDIIDIEEVTE